MGQQENASPEPRFEVVSDRGRAAAAVKFYRIRNFEKLQHYKDRALVWVKLYVEELDDYEFLQLPDAAKYHIHALMLLAARSGNKIPNDALWVAARIGASEPVDLQLLFSCGFLEEWRPRAQESYSPGEQLDLPEAAGAATAPNLVNPATPNVAPSTASAPASKLLADSYGSASNLLAQNRTEQSREDTDTDTAPASAERRCVQCGECVASEFSLPEAGRLVERWKAEGRLVGGRRIENGWGLAHTLHHAGTADEEMRLLLRPPPRREFTPEACPTCFGSKYKTVPGRGAEKCPDCVDERGVRTGKRAVDLGGRGP